MRIRGAKPIPEFGTWALAHRGDSLNCVISTEEDLHAQIEAAIKFLSANRTALTGSSFSERGAVLDFGIWQKDNPAVFNHFPARLVSLAGKLHVSIELSQYSSSEG